MATIGLGRPAVRQEDLGINVRALEADLRRGVRGEVRFDPGSRGAYASDGSNYRQGPLRGGGAGGRADGGGAPPPAGGWAPPPPDDVVAAGAPCRRHGAPVLGRGGGTSLAGQGCNVAVVLDFTKYMHRLLELDPDRGAAPGGAGNYPGGPDRTGGRHGLTFGPDPSTHDHCAIGGMIGNNACGAPGQMGGRGGGQRRGA